MVKRRQHQACWYGRGLLCASTIASMLGSCSTMRGEKREGLVGQQLQ